MPDGRGDVGQPVGGGSASADAGATHGQAGRVSDEGRRGVQRFFIGSSDGNIIVQSVDADMIKILEEKLAMSEAMTQNASNAAHALRYAAEGQLATAHHETDRLKVSFVILEVKNLSARIEWDTREIKAERAAALRGEQFAESVIRSNPDIACKITGGQLVHADDANAELSRLQRAGECLQHSRTIAMQERASEAADAAKLKSEFADALKHIEMLKFAGQQVVQEARQEEAERQAGERGEHATQALGPRKGNGMQAARGSRRGGKRYGGTKI